MPGETEDPDKTGDQEACAVAVAEAVALERAKAELVEGEGSEGGEESSKVPVQVRRFQRWIKDAFFWAFYVVRKEPFAVAAGVALLVFSSKAFVDYVIEEDWVDAEDFPFATQIQHAEALCEIRQVGHDACTLLVITGQRDAAECQEPAPCNTSKPSE